MDRFERYDPDISALVKKKLNIIESKREKSDNLFYFNLSVRSNVIINNFSSRIFCNKIYRKRYLR